MSGDIRSGAPTATGTPTGGVSNGLLLNDWSGTTVRTVPPDIARPAADRVVWAATTPVLGSRIGDGA